MATLTLRSLTRPGDTTKNAPLTNAEVDTNFINLDEDISQINLRIDGLPSEFQEPLVSGVNIKTIKGNSLLGSGDLNIGGINFRYINAAVTLADAEGVLADSSAGSFTVTLPATPTEGVQCFINDGGDWGANPVTVARNGSTIEGLADDLVLDIAKASAQFIYSGATWKVFAQIGVANLVTKSNLPNQLGTAIKDNTIEKATPADADEFAFSDSAATWSLKKFSWAKLKQALFGSPTFTGTPTAPTPDAADNSMKLATTAYVKNNLSSINTKDFAQAASTSAQDGVALVQWTNYALSTNSVYQRPLPATPAVGDTIVLTNSERNWNLACFSVTRANAAHSINGKTEDLLFDSNAISQVTLRFVGSNKWVMSLAY